MDRKFIVSVVIASFVLVFLQPPELLKAQSDTTPEGVSDEAAQALGKDRGKTEEEQLEEILSEQRNEFDLISSGNFKVDYSVNYSFNSNPRTQIAGQNDTGFIINDLTRDSQHTLNQNFNIQYGYWNNLTTGISIPIVAKLNTATDVSKSAFGDVSLSSRYQPYVPRPGEASITLFSNVNLPTGESSFEIDRDQELSTGSGLYGVSGGINVSKSFDPVVAFGNFGLNINLPKDDLEQDRGGDILTEVQPGPSLSWGMGIAYSLSYDVSLTYSFNYALSFPSEFTFRRPGVGTFTTESNTSVSGTFNISTGWRVDPRYQITVGLGLGLTEDSQDFSLNFSVPLVLESPTEL